MVKRSPEMVSSGLFFVKTLMKRSKLTVQKKERDPWEQW